MLFTLRTFVECYTTQFNYQKINACVPPYLPFSPAAPPVSLPVSVEGHLLDPDQRDDSTIYDSPKNLLKHIHKFIK